MAEGRAAPPGDLLTVRDEPNGVRLLALNRPSAYNSLSQPLIEALQAAAEAARHDPAVRVLVIRGQGKGFCAGHDLAEVLAFETDAERYALLEACAAMMQTLHHLPKPVIAQVHGTASAAGCQLVATADLAFAAEDARFATPGVNIGLFCSTPMVALGRAVGAKQAMKMLLTGQAIGAEEAVRIGLINEALPAERLDARVLEVAALIAAKSSHVVGLGKRAFRRQAEMPLEAAYAFCNDVVVRNLKAEDATEGIAAFLEKRAPQWQDR